MINYVSQLMVGNAAGTASTSITTLTTDYASVILGDLYLVNSSLKVIAAASDITPVIHVVQGTGAGTMKVSAPIRISDITSIKLQAYVATAQKIIHLGNIGSSTLDLAVTNGKTYKMVVVIKDDQRFMPQRQTRREYAFTTNFASTTPTTAEKAAFIQQYVDAINNDDFLNDYVIASLNTSTVYHGIKLLGRAQTYNRLNNRYEYVDFITSFFDVTDSTSTYTGTATVSQDWAAGNGTYAQVDALEAKLKAWEGTTNRIQFPIPTPTYYTVVGTNYDLFSINWLSDQPGMLEGRDRKPLCVIVAASQGTTQSTNFATTVKLLNNVAAGVIGTSTSFLDSDIA